MFIYSNINTTKYTPTFGFNNSALKNAANKAVNSSTINTSVEIDRLKSKLKTDYFFVSKTAVKAGEISIENKHLLDKICSLHKNINNVLKILTTSEINKLKKEYPNFTKYKTDYSISFNKYNKTGIGLTLVNNIYNFNSNSVLAIYLKDRQNNIIDVLPIKNNNILRMREDAKISKFSNPLNYILEDEYLTQSEINSKNLNLILNTLHSELKNFYEVLALGGGFIEEELSDNIISVDKEIKQIKKMVALKKIRPKNFKIYPNGAIELSNINKNGEKLYWHQGSTNKKSSGTTIIQLLSANNELIDGIAINDERIVANYPLEHKDNFPQSLNFLTSEEIKKLGMNNKIELFIEYFNNGKEAFYKDFNKKLEFNKQFSKIF